MQQLIDSGRVMTVDAGIQVPVLESNLFCQLQILNRWTDRAGLRAVLEVTPHGSVNLAPGGFCFLFFGEMVMDTVEQGQQHVRWRPLVVGMVALIGCLGAIMYLALRPDSEVLEISSGPFGETTPGPSATEIRQELFETQVIPAIQQADQANREAANRCLSRVADAFRRYRAGVDPFAEHVTSLGTKFGVLRRIPGDWCFGQNEADAFIARKLERHVFSAQVIQRDLEAALAQFREDVESNRSAMLRQVKAATTDMRLPPVRPLDASDFSEDAVEKVRQYSTATAKDGATSLIITEVASGTAGYAVEPIFAAIAVRIGTMASGATAASAAAGGGGGTVAGPVGTSIGIAGGLLVGLVIDYWLSENAKTHLRKQLSGLIDQVEAATIHGIEADACKNIKAQPSLKSMLQQACDDLERAYHDVLQQGIVGPAT